MSAEERTTTPHPTDVGITDRDVADAMVRFGGSFVQALGRAFYTADAENQQKIKATWPEYWLRYTQTAKQWLGSDR